MQCWSATDWDSVVTRSRANTIFMRSAWLRACLGVADECDEVFTLTARSPQGTPIGVSAFVVQEGVLKLAGSGPSDYLDLAIDARLPREAAVNIQRAMIARAFQQSPQATRIILCGLVEQTGTPRALEDWAKGPYLTKVNITPAPFVERLRFDEIIRRRGFRRCENRLAREGRLTCEHYRSAEDIVPRLDEFFDQHERRWKGTDSPSLFEDARNRELYRRVTQELSATGWLVHTEVRLAGQLVAAHFGFLYGGRFIWYKPSFEPALAKLSPGQVLLRRLFELARDEGVQEFDFTIGGEDFKSRYATVERSVANIHMTNSLAEAIRINGLIRLRRFGRRALELLGAIKPRTARKELEKKGDDDGQDAI